LQDAARASAGAVAGPNLEEIQLSGAALSAFQPLETMRVDASVTLEELHGALMAFRRRKRLEGAEVPSLPGARVPLARIEAEPA